MDGIANDLSQKIKKGSAPDKVDAYRRLIIGYASEDEVKSAIANQLAVEANGKVYHAVETLDLTAGPRLDWRAIRTARLQKCKKADERYDALSADHGYGTDTRVFLESVVQNDDDQSVRRRALDTLLAKNKGSDDLPLLAMAQAFLENEDGLRDVERSMIWDGIAYLGQSPQQITYFDGILAQLTPENARNVGRVISILYASGVPYDQKILSLCRDAYGADPQNEPGVETETAKALYVVIENFCKHRTFAPDFMKYIFAWATGPMVHFAEKHDQNGWGLLRAVRDLLGRSDAHRPLATDLLFQLIGNERILDRERGFAVPYYVRSCRDQGLSEDEIAAQLAPLTRDDEDPVSKNIRMMLNQDPNVATKREAAKQKFTEQKRRTQIVKKFAGFVVPFSVASDLEASLAPVIGAVKIAETLTATTILQAFIGMQSQPNGVSLVLTLDREDRASASEVIEALRHFLALPTEDNLYTDENMYNASVQDQLALYAAHLARFDLSLAYIDVGWDDPCAVVLSQPDAFSKFLAEELPDMTCTVVNEVSYLRIVTARVGVRTK